MLRVLHLKQDQGIFSLPGAWLFFLGGIISSSDSAGTCSANWHTQLKMGVKSLREIPQSTGD